MCYFRDAFLHPSPLLLSSHSYTCLLVVKVTSTEYLKHFFSLQKYPINNGVMNLGVCDVFPIVHCRMLVPKTLIVGSGNKQNVKS